MNATQWRDTVAYCINHMPMGDETYNYLMGAVEDHDSESKKLNQKDPLDQEKPLDDDAPRGLSYD